MPRGSMPIFYCLFGALWIIVFSQGLTASSCRNERLGPEKRSRYCSASIFIGAWIPLSDPYKASIIYAERGLAYSRLGRNEDAVRDFAVAWGNAQQVTPDRNDLALDAVSSRQQDIVDMIRREGRSAPAERNFKMALDQLGVNPAYASDVLSH